MERHDLAKGHHIQRAPHPSGKELHFSTALVCLLFLLFHPLQNNCITRAECDLATLKVAVGGVRSDFPPH